MGNNQTTIQGAESANDTKPNFSLQRCCFWEATHPVERMLMVASLQQEATKFRELVLHGPSGERQHASINEFVNMLQNAPALPLGYGHQLFEYCLEVFPELAPQGEPALEGSALRRVHDHIIRFLPRPIPHQVRPSQLTPTQIERSQPAPTFSSTINDNFWEGSDEEMDATDFEDEDSGDKDDRILGEFSSTTQNIVGEVQDSSISTTPGAGSSLTQSTAAIEVVTPKQESDDMRALRQSINELTDIDFKNKMMRLLALLQQSDSHLSRLIDDLTLELSTFKLIFSQDFQSSDFFNKVVEPLAQDVANTNNNSQIRFIGPDALSTLLLPRLRPDGSRYRRHESLELTLQAVEKGRELYSECEGDPKQLRRHWQWLFNIEGVPDILFMTYNIAQHWFPVVLTVDEGRSHGVIHIENSYMDSNAAPPHKLVVETVRYEMALITELLSIHPTLQLQNTRWEYMVNADVPQQRNGFDCGFFHAGRQLYWASAKQMIVPSDAAGLRKLLAERLYATFVGDSLPENTPDSLAPVARSGSTPNTIATPLPATSLVGLTQASSRSPSLPQTGGAAADPTKTLTPASQVAVRAPLRPAQLDQAIVNGEPNQLSCSPGGQIQTTSHVTDVGTAAHSLTGWVDEMNEEFARSHEGRLFCGTLQSSDLFLWDGMGKALSEVRTISDIYGKDTPLVRVMVFDAADGDGHVTIPANAFESTQRGLVIVRLMSASDGIPVRYVLLGADYDTYFKHGKPPVLSSSETVVDTRDVLVVADRKEVCKRLLHASSTYGSITAHRTTWVGGKYDRTQFSHFFVSRQQLEELLRVQSAKH